MMDPKKAVQMVIDELKVWVSNADLEIDCLKNIRELVKDDPECLLEMDQEIRDVQALRAEYLSDLADTVALLKHEFGEAGVETDIRESDN